MSYRFGNGTVIDVRSYGAKGDGVADDRLPILNALNAVAAAGGGQVRLPAGTYKITNRLSIGSNTELIGDGPMSVIKPMYASINTSNRVIDNDWINGNINISLRNFKIDRSGSWAQHGILLNGVTNLLIDSLHMSGANNDVPSSGAIAVSGVNGSTLADLPSFNVRVTNCIFSDTTNYGVQFGYVDGGVMANNTCYNAGREVLGVEPEITQYSTNSYAKNITIANNTIYGSPIVFGSVTGFIIVTESSGGPVENVAITGNVIRQAAPHTDAQPGITINGASGVTVTGNVITEMGGSGISVGTLDPLSQIDGGVLIQGNVITNCSLTTPNQLPGIMLRYAKNIMVVGNYVRGDHSYDITEELASQGNLIAMNDFGKATPIGNINTSTGNGIGTVFHSNKIPGQGVQVRGNPAQSASLQQWTDSAGTAHVSVTAATSSKRANLVMGSSAVATNATDGFVYLSSMAGAPTGTPTAFTGAAPIVLDTTNNKLMAYINGAWRGVTLT